MTVWSANCILSGSVALPNHVFPLARVHCARTARNTFLPPLSLRNPHFHPYVPPSPPPISLTTNTPFISLSHNRKHTHTHPLTHTDPISPTLLSYIIGLAFYATNFPERSLPASWAPYFGKYLGGGSHAVWHLFIVLAISKHRAAMPVMRGMAGMGEVC